MAPRKRVLECIVPCCKETSAKSEITFFKFPIDPQRKTQWMNSIGLSQADLIKKHNFVCQKHFKPENIGTKYLTKNAVPALKLSNVENENNVNLSPSASFKIVSAVTQTEPVDKDVQFLEIINKENLNLEATKIGLPSTNELGSISMPKVTVSTKLFSGNSMENKIKVDNKPTASCSTETNNFENLLNECLVKNELPPETDGKATSTKTMSIIADNLECSSSDSLTGEATNDQNIFSTNFTYKNPLFLQKRIDKYEDDLQKVIDEQEQVQNKLVAQKEKTKASKKRKVKQMVEFHEIYDKPKMKIPKLIFERFMTDYEKEECSEELKQFAAEVNSRSADSYMFLRECLGNIFPPAFELPECSKEVRSIQNDEDENMSADAEDQGHDEDPGNDEDPENVYLDDDEDEED